LLYRSKKVTESGESSRARLLKEKPKKGARSRSGEEDVEEAIGKNPDFTPEKRSISGEREKQTGNEYGF